MTKAYKTLIAGLAVPLMTLAITPSMWRYRKPIQLTPGDRVSAVKIDHDVYTGARSDLSDLRVLRDGEEIAFVLETLGAAYGHQERPAEIFDRSVDPKSGLQLTLRLDGSAKHNRVRLATGETNFRQRVRIETSENGRAWSIARDDGAIFDFSQGSRHLYSLSVEYPVSMRRYVRVTVVGWTKVGAVTAAFADYKEEHAASRETLVSTTPQVVEDTAAHATVATMDTGADGLPVDQVRIETSSPAFQRAVEVETSADGNEWDYLGQGVVARLPGEESLAVAVPETHRRHIRLRVYNRDDKPIQIGSVKLEGIVRRVKFLTPSPGHYWLYYGNPAAVAPQYDLPALLARREHGEEADWTAGPGEANPAYLEFRPWSERHPSILYTVLGAAVLGLAAATLRFALRLRQPPQPN